MSEQSDKQNINATALVDNFNIILGKSKKTGNDYLVGSLFIKSPISDTPIRLNLDYIDDNTRELLLRSLTFKLKMTSRKELTTSSFFVRHETS